MFFCFWFLSLTSAVASTDDMDSIYEQFTEVCPYTNFCHSNVTKQLNDSSKMPCCLPCSCDHKCPSLGNCCPDVVTQNMGPPVTKCKLTMVKGAPADDKEYDGILHDIRRYRIKDSCPKEEKNDTLIDHCKGYKIESVDDYIWVSDTNIGVIYQNRYCALCNHVTNFTQWQTRTTFSSVLFMDLSLSDIMKVDLDLIMEVPDSERESAIQYRCFLPRYSKCDKIKDPSVVSACQSDDMYSPVLQELPYGLVVYKNIFCYMCNVVDLGRWPTTCSKLDGAREVTDVPFSAIIDFTRQPQPSNPLKELTCQINEVYDPYEVGVCQAIFRVRLF